jgi:predicted MFS family arabinose efflux permease
VSDPVLRRASWALLAGNFAVGCGVMVAAGSLNDLVASLGVTVAVGGQLIALAAVVMCLGAPLMAAVLAGFDRRRLLTAALAFYGAGHLLSALMPDYAWLLAVRAVTMLGAALFSPQAAAAIGTMAPPAERGRAITFVFLGWSVASVAGIPTASFVAETAGWRWSFALVGGLALAAALGVWHSIPDGVKPPPLSLASWKRIATQPLLVGLVLVTAFSGAGQFTLFSYFAPYFRQELGATALGVSLLFLWFGAFGVLGNVLVSHFIDRLGAHRAVAAMLAAMLVSLLAWPLAGGAWSMAIVLVPWALGCFSSNSAQQARGALADPALAPAMVSLNTSAIYLGQAVGTASGGALLAGTGGWAALPWAGAAWMALAIATSLWIGARRPAAA